MMDAKQQAEEIWRIGNKHGADADRKRDIADSLEIFAASVRAEAILAADERAAKLLVTYADLAQAAIRSRTATQAEGKLDVWADQLERGEFAGTKPQPPASPSQEGGMREEMFSKVRKRLVEAARLAGGYPSKGMLAEIVLAIAQFDAALAHDDGRGK